MMRTEGAGTMQTILQQLLAQQDPQYQRFQQRLLPELAPERILGVRTPALRQLAKQLAGTPEAEPFCSALPHTYFEENQLHAFMLEGIRDFDEALRRTETFLPYVDNWATCDQFCPRVFARQLPRLRAHIPRWLQSGRTYTVRFAMEQLMRFYLDDAFDCVYFDWVVQAQRQAYYVRMMCAWYFATALYKQYDAALPVLLERRLEPWTHNKTIQKAVESRRVPPDRKEYLKTLRITQK